VKKFLIFIVSFNAERHIASVFSRIPYDRLPEGTELLLIDDASNDSTFVAAQEASRNCPIKCTLLKNPVNLGYGGNQKLGYEFAITQGFDAVVLIHGDGQYAPELIPEMFSPIAEGKADLVLGSRMLRKIDAIKGGMPLYKWIGNQVLTWIENWILPLILVAGAAASPRRIPLILIFLAGFAAGPLIFTNLYFEHNYYWVANGVWLLLALGVALACIAECDPKSRWPAPVTVSLGASVCIAGFTAWHQIFFPIIQKLPTRETFAEAWAKPIQKIVPAGRTLLILSQNWNPNAHYFAQRKGVSFPTGDNFAFDGEELQQSLTLLDLNEKLGAVVINQDFLTQENQPFFFGLLQSLGMQTNGFASPFGIVFPARTTTDQ
jgi:glycosyltransferase involved in cell wall biosynthesis